METVKRHYKKHLVALLVATITDSFYLLGSYNIDSFNYLRNHLPIIDIIYLLVIFTAMYLITLFAAREFFCQE